MAAAPSTSYDYLKWFIDTINIVLPRLSGQNRQAFNALFPPSIVTADPREHLMFIQRVAGRLKGHELQTTAGDVRIWELSCRIQGLEEQLRRAHEANDAILCQNQELKGKEGGARTVIAVLEREKREATVALIAAKAEIQAVRTDEATAQTSINDLKELLRKETVARLELQRRNDKLRNVLAQSATTAQIKSRLLDEMKVAREEPETENGLLTADLM